MAEQTILTKVKLRHDIASNWTSKNPVLLEGEIGFETDTLNFKVGNGSSNWNSLKYYIPDTSKFVTEDKLPDTSKFITISADNLINYYLKSETYTKEEVNSIINNVSKFNAVIVTTLPTSNISLTTIYLVAKTDTENNDYYDEYLYINNAWEMIGNTKIDLSNYYTKTQADNVFALKTDIPEPIDTSNIPITITTTSVRIWDLASGTYILPNKCKIYYNGSTNTTDYYNAQGEKTLLYINTSKEGTEKFFRFEYTTGFNAYYQYYIFAGMTTSNNGYVKGVNLNGIYPDGAVYISTNTTSPASIFGGTWEELPENVALWTTTISSANAGTTIDAGLPNITATLGLKNHASTNTVYGGAFSQNGSESNTHTGMNSNNRTYTNAYFDANKSNSIYGNSTTVQPPAYRVYAWRRIS